METEITSFLDSQTLAAPLTSKLLGNSQIPYNKFTRKSTSLLDFGSIGLKPSIANMTKVPSTINMKITVNEKDQSPENEKSEANTKKVEEEEEMLQHCTAGIEEHIVKHLNKTTKYAFIFKLKKEEIRQVEKGDISVLQTLFKSITGDMTTNTENFRFVPDRDLSAVMENVRQTSDVFELKRLKRTQKQLELSIDKWTLQNPTKANKHKQTHSEERDSEVDTDDLMKPIKFYLACRKSKNCDQYTQYEQQDDICNESEKLQHNNKRLSIDKCIQCKLVARNGAGNLHRTRKAQLETATKGTQYAIEFCNELKLSIHKEEEEDEQKYLDRPQDSLMIIRKKLCNKRKQQAERLKAGELPRIYFSNDVQKDENNENDIEKTMKMNSTIKVKQWNRSGKSEKMLNELKNKKTTIESNNEEHLKTQPSAAGKSRNVVFGNFDYAEFSEETSTFLHIEEELETLDNKKSDNDDFNHNTKLDLETNKIADEDTNILQEKNFINEFIEEQLKALKIVDKEGNINFESAKNIEEKRNSKQEINKIKKKKKEKQINEEKNEIINEEVKSRCNEINKNLDIDKLKIEAELDKCHERLIIELLNCNEAKRQLEISKDSDLNKIKSETNSNDAQIEVNENYLRVESIEEIQVNPERKKSNKSKIPIFDHRNSKINSSKQNIKELKNNLYSKESNVVSAKKSDIKILQTQQAIPKRSKIENEKLNDFPTTSAVKLDHEPISKIIENQKTDNQTIIKASKIPILIRRKTSQSIKFRLSDENSKLKNVVKEQEQEKQLTAKELELQEWKTRDVESLPAATVNSWDTVNFQPRNSRSGISYYEKQRKLIELIVRGVEHEIQSKSSHNLPN